MNYDEYEDDHDYEEDYVGESVKLCYVGTDQEVIEGDRVIVKFIDILWVGHVVSVTYVVERDESISISGGYVDTTAYVTDTTIGVVFEDTLDTEQAAPGGYYPLLLFRAVKDGKYPARYVTIERLVPLP